MLYKHAATAQMTESELRGLVRLLNHPDFDSFDISAEMGDRQTGKQQLIINKFVTGSFMS